MDRDLVIRAPNYAELSGRTRGMIQYGGLTLRDRRIMLNLGLTMGYVVGGHGKLVTVVIGGHSSYYYQQAT
jgi:hypothetical protein